MSNRQQIILITGPSSSGKSEFAESLAFQSSRLVVYLATAQADENDHEWQSRILKHQQRRPKTWETRSVSTELAIQINTALETECLLIDSLGTWVASFLDLEDSSWKLMQTKLLTSLETTKAKILLVGEETGWGIVPTYPSGRLFRDRLGNLSRQIGNVADTTYLVTGGHVLNLSLLGQPLNNYKI